MDPSTCILPLYSSELFVISTEGCRMSIVSILRDPDRCLLFQNASNFSPALEIIFSLCYKKFLSHPIFGFLVLG